MYVNTVINAVLQRVSKVKLYSVKFVIVGLTQVVKVLVKCSTNH